MDKIKGKGTNDNQHSYGQQFYGRVFLKSRVLVGQYQICHLYDIELIVLADSVLNRSVREQQMCKVIVRKAVDMVGNITGNRRVLSA